MSLAPIYTPTPHELLSGAACKYHEGLKEKVCTGFCFGLQYDDVSKLRAAVATVAVSGLKPVEALYRPYLVVLEVQL